MKKYIPGPKQHVKPHHLDPCSSRDGSWPVPVGALYGDDWGKQKKIIKTIKESQKKKHTWAQKMCQTTSFGPLE